MIYKKISQILKPGILMYALVMLGLNMYAQDPCLEHDDCIDAFDFGTIPTDDWSLRQWGCNLYASPDTLISSCLMGDYPTVWYKFKTDGSANLLTVILRSGDFNMPVISVFKSENENCTDLEQVLLTNSNLPCVIGSHGRVQVIGTSIEAGTTYYLAVSSYQSIGGWFNFRLGAFSDGLYCVEDRSIQIIERENGGPLEGPFDPDETISICFNVNRFSAANNGCQWFQGIVPVFGNGWDPSSFDSLGQPLNATINGEQFGVPGNGLYTTGNYDATWNWFDSVDYHVTNIDFSIDDFDDNGRMDMCNSRYDNDCPVMGVHEGCCRPCWADTLGSILPPGWFAYGINGSCPDPGPPVRLDWGDGNTCGGGMGPWQFCFDLITRDITDCGADSTTRDLSLGFHTFADGETGAWTGSPSICTYDAPLNLTLESSCGRTTTLDPEILAPLNSGDTLFYLIEEPDILDWEWNISPFWAVPYLQNTGPNGFSISAPLVNESVETIDVTGIFIGHYEPNFAGSNDRLVKKIKFKLHNALTNSEEVNTTPVTDLYRLKVYPIPVTDAAMLEWHFELHGKAVVTIFDARGKRISEKTVFPDDGQRTQIDTDEWTSGVYFVRFGNGEFQSTTKMVKK